MRIYLITSDMKDERQWFERIDRILKSGIDMLQYRDKANSTLTIHETARKLKILCKKYNTPLIINNRVDVCMALDADGVHLGGDDLPIETARKIMGPEKIIGASARTVEAIKNGEIKRVDYFGSGAMFDTDTKVDAKKISKDQLKLLVDSTSLPVYAIGGINAENVHQLENTGIAGVCLSAGLMLNSDPEGLIEKIKGM
ncbi:thiamine phosphate synthase [Gudongella sp. SC589]|uniref:thiamine phosphate synthase n=1 Tax=Gudongella sp. SC589 TaxID=3385990 RepID=UPI003904DD5D